MFYHGTNHKIEKFTDEFVGGQKAIDADGPGIYFTTDWDDARQFGSIIYTVKLNPRKIVHDKPGRLPEKDLVWLIKKSGDWQSKAQNWDENPQIGLAASIKSIYEYNETPFMQLLQVYKEYYKDSIQFVRNAAKLQYDAIFLEKEWGATHAVVLNPAIISLIEVKDDRTEEEKRLGEVRNIIKKTLEENFTESEFKIPQIPNTMNFWHGGNLDDYNDIIAQKNGRYEFGPGLYITTHYDTAKKYAKGSRKMYLVTVEKGVDINDAFLELNKAKEFLNSYVIGSKRKSIMNFLSKYIENDKVPASIFNNLILNHHAIQSTKIKYLREFLVNNGIDYELVSNPFGWGETMMVLYNMKKIVQTIVVKSTDRPEKYNLHEDSLIQEDYNSVKEITFLANEVLKAAAKANFEYINRQIKEDPESNSIRFYSVKLIDVYQQNPKQYPILQDFIINSNVNVAFGLSRKDANIKGHYVWSREEYDTTKQRFITLFYDESLSENLKEKFKNKPLDEGDVYFSFYYVFESTLEHEVQHAYDDFRSKSNIFYNKRFDKYNSKYHLPSGEETKINDPDMQGQKHVDYLKLQHEIEARFTQAISKTRFTSSDIVDSPDDISYVHYKMKPLSDVLKNFKYDFVGWRAMSDKVKKNLYRRVSQYWHKEAEALPEKNKKSLEKERAAATAAQLSEVRRQVRNFLKNKLF